MENLEPMVQCPLDKSHRVRKSRLQVHLVRCQKNFDLSEKTKCPYNSTHIVYKTDYAAHLRDCPDSGIVLNEIYDDGSDRYVPAVSLEEIQATPVPETAENWDDEPDVPSYNPMAATENRMVIRHPVGLSKSQRKAFRLQERARFSKLAEMQPEERSVPAPASTSAGMFHKMDHSVPLRERKTMSMAQSINNETDVTVDLDLSQLSISDSSTYNSRTKSRGKDSSPSSSSSSSSSSSTSSSSCSTQKGSDKSVKRLDRNSTQHSVSSKNYEKWPISTGESTKLIASKNEPQKIEKIEKTENEDENEIRKIEKRIQELQEMEIRIKEEKEKLERMKNRESAPKSDQPILGSRCAANFSNLRSPGGQSTNSNSSNPFKCGIGRGSIQNLSLSGVNSWNPFLTSTSFAKKTEKIINNNNSNINNGIKVGVSPGGLKNNLENKENEERRNLETEDLDFGDFDDVQLDDEDINVIMENSKAT